MGERKLPGRVVISLDLVGALVWSMVLGGLIVLAVIGAFCLLGGG